MPWLQPGKQVDVKTRSGWMLGTVDSISEGHVRVETVEAQPVATTAAGAGGSGAGHGSSSGPRPVYQTVAYDINTRDLAQAGWVAPPGSHTRSNAGAATATDSRSGTSSPPSPSPSPPSIQTSVSWHPNTAIAAAIVAGGAVEGTAAASAPRTGSSGAQSARADVGRPYGYSAAGFTAAEEGGEQAAVTTGSSGGNGEAAPRRRKSLFSRLISLFKPRSGGLCYDETAAGIADSEQVPGALYTRSDPALNQLGDEIAAADAAAGVGGDGRGVQHGRLHSTHAVQSSPGVGVAGLQPAPRRPAARPAATGLAARLKLRVPQSAGNADPFRANAGGGGAGGGAGGVGQILTPTPLSKRRGGGQKLYRGQPADVLTWRPRETWGPHAPRLSSIITTHTNGTAAAGDGDGDGDADAAAQATVRPSWHARARPDHADVLPVWLPGRIVELRGGAVKVQVYVPPPGLKQGTNTVAGWLTRLSSDPEEAAAAAAALARPHCETLTLAKHEVPLRLSWPAGLRSGVSGDSIKALWPDPDKEAAKAAAAAGAAAAAARQGGPHGPALVQGASGRGAGTPMSRLALPRAFFSSTGGGAGLAAASGSKCAGDEATHAQSQQQQQQQHVEMPPLQTGLEVDVRGADGSWKHGIITAVHTDALLLHALGSDHHIGRGGFAIQPMPLAVDVAYSHNGATETISLSANRLAPAFTRATSPIHQWSAGDYVDVVTVLVDAEHYAAAGEEMASWWRRAEVVEVAGNTICVRYLSEAGGEAPELEWIDLAIHSWRVRPFGEHTDRASEEQDAAATEDAAFTAALRAAGWIVLPEQTDGNCLFRAVAHQIYGAAAQHQRVRQEAVSYMQQHGGFFGPLAEAFDPAGLDSYADDMSRDGAWGGWVELLAIEERYDRPITVWSSEAFLSRATVEPRGIHFSGEIPEALAAQLEAVTPIRLSYHGSSHYQSVVPAADAAAPPFPLGARDTGWLRSARESRMAASLEEEEVRLRAIGEEAAREKAEEVLRKHIRHATTSLSRLSMSRLSMSIQAAEAEGAGSKAGSTAAASRLSSGTSTKRLGSKAASFMLQAPVAIQEAQSEPPQ